MTQPRIHRNRWRDLDVPALGAWSPTLTVTVVIPAHDAHATLPLTLASLAGQSYPDHLLDVVVVDDGSSPPLELPPVRPARTTLITTSGSWGRGRACHQGAEASQGQVLLWLDADMIVDHRHVEAQLRWHHVIDHVVVLGEKNFIDPNEGLPDPEALQAATAAGSTAALLADRWSQPGWVEEFYARHDDLHRAAWRAYRVHVGATGSVSRALYNSAGGMDPALKLGEDIELGYRLSQRGAVFVPDREAHGWHIGLSNQHLRNDDVRRHNDPFFADRCPDLRYLRESPGRSYAVPLVEVVVDATRGSYESVRHTVDGVLRGDPADVRCLVRGPWRLLTDERRSPLEDPMLEARLVQAEYAHDPRVALFDDVPESAFPATFRAHLPVGWAPGPRTLGRLVEQMQADGHGLRSVLLPDGTTARLMRTAAFERAVRLRGPGDDLDDLVDEVAGTWWNEGREEGFTHVDDPAPAAGDEHRPRPVTPTPTSLPPPAPARGVLRRLRAVVRR